MGSPSGRSDRGGADLANQGRSFSDFDAALARAQVKIETACSRHDEWPDRVAAGINSALDLAASDPGTAYVLSVEAMSSGADGLACFRRLVDHFAQCLRRGRELQPQREQPPEITEATLLGGLVSLIAQRLNSGDQATLPAEAPGLICFVLTPYLGFERADAVARRHTA